MITYSKELTLKINYIEADKAEDKRAKVKELNLSYISYGRFSDTMEIQMPNGDKIHVSAEWLKEACTKVIDLKKI